MKLQRLLEEDKFEHDGGSLIGKKIFQFHERHLITGKEQSWPRHFDCASMYLTSLEGAPKKINGYFNCDDNKLKSLDGAPSEVNGGFRASNNKLTSLEGIHKIVKVIEGTFYVHDNPIKSHVLGLLLIKGVRKLELAHWQKVCDLLKAQEIMNHYLPNPTNARILECQNELIDAGLDEYAQL